MDDQELRVVDRADDRRYELVLGETVISFATYRLRDGVVVIPHVETTPELRGRGFADTLLSGIVDDVRTRELTVRALCPYAASFLHDNPSTHDVLAD